MDAPDDLGYVDLSELPELPGVAYISLENSVERHYKGLSPAMQYVFP